MNGERFAIGRLGNNDLVLNDPSVSRHHAEVRRTPEGHYRIVDLDSMNGVYVNGKRVHERALLSGDDIELGDVRISFELRLDDLPEYEQTRVMNRLGVELDRSNTGKVIRDP